MVAPWYPRNEEGRNWLKLRPYLLSNGAEGENRTRTSMAHCALNTACLPIPPLRHQNYLFVSGGTFPSPVGIAALGSPGNLASAFPGN